MLFDLLLYVLFTIALTVVAHFPDLLPSHFLPPPIPPTCLFHSPSLQRQLYIFCAILCTVHKVHTQSSPTICTIDSTQFAVVGCPPSQAAASRSKQIGQDSFTYFVKHNSTHRVGIKI
ncbi:hypothetical protein FKM82_012793 [Ascaphus truei]